LISWVIFKLIDEVKQQISKERIKPRYSFLYVSKFDNPNSFNITFDTV